MESKVIALSLAALCVATVWGAPEKQIKLEDIEKDTLKAAQQAKIEKQLLEQRQQQQQLQQHHQLQFHQPYGGHHSVAYQTPTSYFQYVVPQNFISQPHSQYIPISDYAASLAVKNVALNYAASPTNQQYQTYFAPQISSIPSHYSSFHGGQQHVETVPQASHSIIMAFANPLSALQQPTLQQFYQGGFQYYPAQFEQSGQVYYSSQVAGDQGTPYSQYSTGGGFSAPSAHRYLTSYHAGPDQSKGTHSHGGHYPSSSSVSLPATTASYASQQGASFHSAFSPQSYSSNAVYSNTETPIFVTVKAPKHLVASSGQKQQFAQTHTTTLSPLQTKYLNSPQYLAQNYNTIQSSALYAKGSLSSGVKSTASPPLKAPLVAAAGGSAYGFPASSDPVPSYQPFKSLPVRTYAI